MKINVKQTDGRFKGSRYFKYYVDLECQYAETNEKNFFAVREWCWETYGPSKEIDSWLRDKNKSSDIISQNQKWCWHNDAYTARIYLRTNKEADWFTLKWT